MGQTKNAEMSNKLLPYITVIIFGMLMASCSSSKKAILSQTHTPQQSEIIIQENKGTKDNRMSKLMSEAKKWVGTKYRYGGQSREGTDCSGMVMALYNQVFGIKLPRSSREQKTSPHSLPALSFPAQTLTLVPSSIIFVRYLTPFLHLSQ